MKLKKLSIGSDHGGFGLKEKLVKSLSEAGFSVADKGTHSSESVDYRDYA